MKNQAFILLLAGALAFTGAACSPTDKPSSPYASAKSFSKPYPLDTCAVCGMKLSDMTPVVFVYQDREIKVCDQDEEAEFKKDPAKYLKAMEKAQANKAPTPKS